jgi:glycolate oxidase
MNAVATPDLRAELLASLRAIRPPLPVVADDEGLKPFETDAFISRRATPMLAALPETDAQVQAFVRACR